MASAQGPFKHNSIETERLIHACGLNGFRQPPCVRKGEGVERGWGWGGRDRSNHIPVTDKLVLLWLPNPTLGAMDSVLELVQVTNVFPRY